MQRCNIATAAVLRSLNYSLSDEMMEMALAEYKVFLAQDAGVPLGYGFRWSWTVGCPFSDDLGITMMQIAGENYDSIGNIRIKEPYAEIIKQVNKLEHAPERKEANLGVWSWYKLLALIAYQVRHGYEEEYEILIKIKDRSFNKEQIISAISVYKNFKTKYALTEEEE